MTLKASCPNLLQYRVILVDVDNIRAENFSKFIYIAGTRARTLLYVVASDEFWKKHK